MWTSCTGSQADDQCTRASLHCPNSSAMRSVRAHRRARLLDQIDALILDAYDLPPRLTRSLLASFTGASRPVTHNWNPWLVSLDDPALSLAEIRSGVLEQARGNWPQQKLKPLPSDEAAQAAPFLP